MENKSERKAVYKDIQSAPWEKRPHSWRKILAQDEDTGMFVSYHYYPSGVVTGPHFHGCSHGMFVLSGTLHTADGEYGPGTMVWFPEGCINEHGAAGPMGVTVLFITNKPFSITMVDQENK